MGERKKVLILDPAIHPDAMALLTQRFSIETLPAHSPEDAVIAKGAGAEALYLRMCDITRKVIEGIPTLRIVSRHGVGYEMVDVAAATDHGVIVTNTPGANATAVSEFAMAGILALARGVNRIDPQMKSGVLWPRDAFMGCELEGKTIGIIGLGKIGTKVAKHCLGFDMRVIGYDPLLSPQQAADLGVEYMAIQDIFQQADYVTVHVPLTDETRHLLNKDSIATMKRGVVIINSARGPIVDEAALIEGLQSGQIGGAVLDTYESEPLAADSPLRTFERVVLSPHAAAQTSESGYRVAMWSAQCVVDALEGRQPAYVVNPEAYEKRRELGKD